jgi:hypothetical protein
VTIADQPAASVGLTIDAAASAMVGQGTGTIAGVPIAVFLEMNDEE